MSLIRHSITLLGAIAVSACAAPGPDLFELGHARYYAPTSWSTLHRDSRNSDYAPNLTPSLQQVVWSALEDAATWVGPTIGPEGNVYVSSGRGIGTSHLHAFDRDGNLLWQSPPMESLADLDYGATINAPVVRDDGTVYQADLDQLRAFTADGELRWTASLRDAGVDGHFVTPILSKQGHVGGISTDGKVLFFDAADGSPIWPAFDLPGTGGPPSQPVPPGLLAGGLQAPEFTRPMWDLVFGREIEVANTPSVHPETGRIFITAGGATPGSGALYGIDLGSDGPRIAFEFPMSQGSGTSPALSPDGSRVYAAGDDGVMVAVDSGSGELVWRAQDTAAAASPSVGPDGTVYSTTAKHGLTAINGRSGERRWEVGFEVLARTWLPRDPKRGPRIALVNSLISLSARKVWLAVDIGYLLTIGEAQVPQAHRHAIVAVDPADGHLICATELPGSSSAFLVPNADGRIYVTLVAAATSMQYYGVNPALPEELRAPGPPRAGLVAYGPASSLAYLREALHFARSSAIEASNKADTDRAAANRALDVARAQTAGLRAVLGDAVAAGELDAARAERIEPLLDAAEAELQLARSAQSPEPLRSAVDRAHAQLGIASVVLARG